MEKSITNIELAIEDLSKLSSMEMRQNEPMSRHTTLRVGGPADLLLYPRSQEDLQSIVRITGEYELPWHVIGRGSNLLVQDNGIRGVVIKLDEGFNDFRVDGTRVSVGGGHSTILLATLMTKNGLTGLEFAGGIPGNIGGAVYMNAGAHGSEIAEVVDCAEILLKNGEITTFSNKDLLFRYRTSILQNEIRGIVLRATFQLSTGPRQEILSTFSRFKNHRKQTQPLQFPCAGSVFRNPPEDYAGRLIEQAGLKGYSIGGAEISTMHGNFIINRGTATARDVLTLIDHAKEAIHSKFNIMLKPEVLVVGEE